MTDQPRQRPATLHDIARLAGVSVITASRALSQPQKVTPATQAKVREAADALGYVPNLLAGGLKSARSMTVAALVPVLAVPQFLPTIQALTESLEAAGYQLILGQTGYDRAREPALLETMLRRRVDGIVSAGLLARGPALQRLLRQGVPLVETWDLGDDAAPADMEVGFSHAAVGRAVAGHVRARGWHHVGVAGADDQRARRRSQGFVAAWGAPVALAEVPAPSSLQAGREALGRLLAQDPALDVVVCSSDGLAHGVLIEARARGLDVPGRLAVIGFGDADFAAHLAPALTTVRVDGAAIGHEAARMLLARCAGQSVEPRRVDLGFTIIERESSARAV
ncbi:MAG: hypothetical protein RLY78_2265 [Pseudomonadota bacterium]|jgi:LacI family gluconate utilization system Gnt-I transcriptional repressor